MTTELLFRDDAYLKTATARVLAVSEHGIELDRTVFYPQGGGQAGDTGTLLRGNGERIVVADTRKGDGADRVRSEEHTSEFQSRVDLVCRLLLEKKKKKKT